MSYIVTTYRFLSEKPSMKVLMDDGTTVEFSPYYETKEAHVAEQLRKIPYIFELDTVQNSVEPLPNSVVVRDDNARAKVAEPAVDDDIVNVSYLNKQLETVSSAEHGHTKYDVGLHNVDNTSDMNKPLSALQKEYVDAQIDVIVSEGVPDATEIVKGKARFASDAEAEEVLNYSDINQLSDVATITPKTLSIPITSLKSDTDLLSQELATTKTLAQNALQRSGGTVTGDVKFDITPNFTTLSRGAVFIALSENGVKRFVRARAVNVNENSTSFQVIEDTTGHVLLNMTMDRGISSVKFPYTIPAPRPLAQTGLGEWRALIKTTTIKKMCIAHDLVANTDIALGVVNNETECIILSNDNGYWDQSLENIEEVTHRVPNGGTWAYVCKDDTEVNGLTKLGVVAGGTVVSTADNILFGFCWRVI